MDAYSTLVHAFGHLFPEYRLPDVGIILQGDNASFTSATPRRKSPCVGFFSYDGVADRVDVCMRSLVLFEKRNEKTYANAVKTFHVDSPRTFGLRYLWAAHAQRAHFERFQDVECLERASSYYHAAINIAAGDDVAENVSSRGLDAILDITQNSRMLSEAFAGLCVVETHRDSNDAAMGFAMLAVTLRPRSVVFINCARIIALAKGNHELALRLTGHVILPMLESPAYLRELALWPLEMRIVLGYMK
jgi:hypothetical protein